jgi:hypothetical protein
MTMKWKSKSLTPLEIIKKANTAEKGEISNGVDSNVFKD